MVLAAFLAIPSLWGLQPAIISGSPFGLKTITDRNEKFIQELSVNNFQNPLEIDSNKNERGSLGRYSDNQVQIEQPPSTTSFPNTIEININNKNGWGSLGRHSQIQVQIEPSTSKSKYK